MTDTARRHPVLASSGLLLLVVAVRVWLQLVGPLPGDRYAVAQFTTPGMEPLWIQKLTSVFSAVGTPPVAAAILLLGFLVLWRWSGPSVALGLVAAAVVIPLNALCKVVSGQTPLWRSTHHSGLNFPSGHVAFVTSVVGYLGWMAARRRQPVCVLLALLVVIGMGPARVVAGAHLVSDVIAGYLVGGAVLVLAAAATPRKAAAATRTA